jgi:hypothetical protein
MIRKVVLSSSTVTILPAWGKPTWMRRRATWMPPVPGQDRTQKREGIEDYAKRREEPAEPGGITGSLPAHACPQFSAGHGGCHDPVHVGELPLADQRSAR